MRLFDPDLPIRNIDEDTLDRSSFSQYLSQTLFTLGTNNQRNSFAVGLIGPWGSGKTSILNMLVYQLHELAKMEKNRIVVLDFHPWMFTDTNSILIQFFEQLSDALDGAINKLNDQREISQALRTYGEAISTIPLISKFGATLLAGGKLLEYSAQKSASIKRLKDQVCEAIEASNSQIFITIDDIDRLSENEIMIIFKLVHAVADFPKIIYLLAFDYDVVVEALSKAQRNAESYIDKIVQLQFNVPQLSREKLFDYLWNGIRDLIKNSSIIQSFINVNELKRITVEIIFPRMDNLRDIKRFMNTLYLKFPAIKEEVHFIDFLLLTAIEVFENHVYKNIAQNRDLLLTRQLQHCSDFLQLISKGSKDTNFTESCLKYMFPNYFGKKLDVLSIDCRIADPYNFDTYFSLSRSSTTISMSRLRSMLFNYDYNTLKNEFATCSENDQEKSVLYKLDEAARSYLEIDIFRWRIILSAFLCVNSNLSVNKDVIDLLCSIVSNILLVHNNWICNNVVEDFLNALFFQNNNFNSGMMFHVILKLNSNVKSKSTMDNTILLGIANILARAAVKNLIKLEKEIKAEDYRFCSFFCDIVDAIYLFNLKNPLNHYKDILEDQISRILLSFVTICDGSFCVKGLSINRSFNPIYVKEYLNTLDKNMKKGNEKYLLKFIEKAYDAKIGLFKDLEIKSEQ